MPFSEFLGNERIVAALRGALRSERVPHALLFSGPPGVGKFTLARLFAQAANCERLKDDSCGECETCKRISRLAEPQRLIEQGLAERGESADAATVERVPLILQSHPDVWALVPDPVRLKNPVARPMLRIGQIRAAQRAAYFQPVARLYFRQRRHHALGSTKRPPENSGRAARLRYTNTDSAFTLFLAADNPLALHAISLRAARDFGSGAHPQGKVGQIARASPSGGAAFRRQPGARAGNGRRNGKQTPAIRIAHPGTRREGPGLRAAFCRNLRPRERS